MVKKIVYGGVVAAIYVALTLLLAPISFGAIQCRVSEALCILPVFMPESVLGLFVGCLLSNIYTGHWIDIVFGSLTTLTAAFLTYKTRKNPWIAMIFPVLLNGIVVGGYIGLFFADGMPVLLSMLSVAAGEAAACYVIGMPLYYMFKKTDFFSAI